MHTEKDEDSVKKRETYFDDKKFLNRALTRSRPCLTLRKLRERLPGVLTVSFFTSSSSIWFRVSYLFDASVRSRTWKCKSWYYIHWCFLNPKRNQEVRNLLHEKYNYWIPQIQRYFVFSCLWQINTFGLCTKSYHFQDVR